MQHYGSTEEGKMEDHVHSATSSSPPRRSHSVTVAVLADFSRPSTSRVDFVEFPEEVLGLGFSSFLERAASVKRSPLRARQNAQSPGAPEDVPHVITAPEGISLAALRLCLSYLEHYAQEAATWKQQQNASEVEASAKSGAEGPLQPLYDLPSPPDTRGLMPTQIPKPLDRPLFEILSPWENEFIAEKLLSGNGDVWQHEMLLEVLRASRYLEIAALESMCLAWCASQMMRMSDQTSNWSEGAELIRRFFTIANDWSGPEEELLRIENAWPSSE